MARRPRQHPPWCAWRSSALRSVRRWRRIAAAESSSVRAVALISPSLDYRGARLDAAAIKKLGSRAVWLVASTEDPYALRTVRELAGPDGGREQRLSAIRAHGTALFTADPDLTPALVDWLRRTLIF